MKRVLSDFSWLMYRSHYAYRDLTARGGPIGAMFGVLEFIRMVLSANPDTKIVFCLDRGLGGRREEFSDYKADRTGEDRDVVFELEDVAIKIGSLDDRVVFCHSEGKEADDIIGALVFHESENYERTIVFSGDNDMCQLMSYGIDVSKQLNRGNFIPATEDIIKEKYKVGSKYLLEMRAMLGDPSDNIPRAIFRLNKKVGAEFAELWYHKGFDSAVRTLEDKGGIHEKWAEKIGKAKEIIIRNYNLMSLTKYSKEDVREGVLHNLWTYLPTGEQKEEGRALMRVFGLKRFQTFLDTQKEEKWGS